MRKKLMLLGIVLTSLFWSCNNDLELFTDPVNLPFVYGIIVPSDTNHYIKVTKTFQKWPEDVDIQDMYYKDDSIAVYIDEFDSENLINSYHALPIEAKDKAEGIFPFPTHKYYKLEGIRFSNKNNYALRIELSSGEVIENEKAFSLQRNIGVNSPNLQIDLGIQEVNFEDISGNVAPYRFHWGQSGGGKEELIFTVVFLEINTETNTTDTVVMPITVYNDLPNDEYGNVIELLGFQDMCMGLSKYLKKSKHIKRRMLNTQIEYVGNIKQAVGFGIGLDIWSESRVLTTYETIMYSQTQDGISKDIPNFSNLKNAVGIFSTRAHRQVTPETNLLFFGSKTLDSLACSPFFYEYNFSRVSINSQGELEFDESSTRCNDL